MDTTEKLELFLRETVSVDPAGAEAPATLPPDLTLMARAQLAPSSQTEPLRALLEDLEITLILPDRPVPLLDHSYLSDAERRDPAIAEEIERMDLVASHCTMIAVDDEEAPIGYWRGMDDSWPLREARVIRLDTEGQFEILAGRTLVEAIAVLQTYDESELDDLRSRFADAGLPLSSLSLDDLLAEADAWQEAHRGDLPPQWE